MNSNKKKDNTKESITKLADEAKMHINNNKYLLEISEIFKQQISLVKNLITNYSLNSSQNISKSNDLAMKYKNELLSLNTKLKEEINKNINKQENILKNINNDLSTQNQTLSQFSIDNFILNNTINKYDSNIISLTNGIEASKKYDIFREPKRESEIELKESKNVFLVYNLECQQKMLSFCRSYTKYKYKNFKKRTKIDILKKNILKLKNIINYYSIKLYGEEQNKNIIQQKIKKNKNNDKNNDKKVDIKKRIRTNPKYKKEFGEKNKNLKNIEKKKFISINENMKENDNNSNESKNKNNSENNSYNKTFILNEIENSLFTNINNEEKKENKNIERKKINILKIDELLDIENIEVKDEDIIDEELNSDDEVFFEKKIKPKKKICIDFLPNVKKEIASINLSQIEFNKLKVINEADAYSLQKRKFEQDNINGKIKNLKKQKKNLEKKIDINKNKINVIHNFIEDVKYNYKLLRPIKVQTSAAGNPVNYIREKLLNIVEETITETEKKDKIISDKYKTGKTAVEEGEEGEENNEELVGSDYSDEDEYIENIDNLENKENENINNNMDNHFEKNKKIFNKNNKEKKIKIKTNLISKFESNDKDDKNENILNLKDNISNNIKYNILGNTIAQSK